VIGIHIYNTCKWKGRATKAKLLHALHALAGKLTIVVAAHRLSTIAGCDKVVDLSNKSAVIAEAAT
jgi:ABC-type multidrug transport system fused ATPase/permease subunit